MQRVQTSIVLIALAALSLAGCGSEKHKSVADYLHDIDSARSLLKEVGKDPAKYASDPNAMNAAQANSLISISKVNDCWPKAESNRITTANTNHACLDAAGYKR